MGVRTGDGEGDGFAAGLADEMGAGLAGGRVAWAEAALVSGYVMVPNPPVPTTVCVASMAF